MKRFTEYIKSARSAEVTMMLGFPATGILFAFSTIEELLNSNIIIFMVAIFFLSSAIYSFNALAGINEDERNERLKSDLGSNKKLFFIWSLVFFIIVFIILFNLIDIRLVILSIISFSLWFLYSFPKVGLKYRPVAGTMIHFVGQIIHFHMGYMILDDFSIHSFMISIYFAILFSSGHINHELIDFDADKLMNINSGAVFFGKRVWKKVSGITFGISSIYMILMIFLGITEALYSVPFVIAGIFHVFYRIKYLKNDLSKARFLKERTFYRTVYFFAGLLFVILKIV